MSKKIKFNLDDVKYLYEETLTPQEDIAKKYKTSVVTLNKFLKENNIIRSRDLKNELRKKLTLEKYGVENVSQLKEVNDKKRASNPRRLTKEIWIERFKQIHEYKYDYSLFTEYKNKNTKIKIICKEHGEFSQTPEAHWRLQQGCPKCRYIKSGESNALTKEEFIERANIFHKNKYDYSLVEYKNQETKVRIICPIHGEFLQRAGDHIYNKAGCPKCTTQQSKGEIEISEWLKSLNINVIERNKNLIYPYEIDIFLPDYNLGIEYNGVFWHCFSKTGKTKHRIKWKLAQSKNIDLIQLWDLEWEQHKEICKSIILNRLGIVKRIMARKCVLKEIPKEEAKIFFNNNHLQGFTIGKYFGLYYNDELISAIIMAKSRFNKNFDWELVRHVNKIGTSVTGGFSKLLKYFRNNYSGSIIDYCDQRWFNGKGHSNAGFKEIGITQPDLHYTDFHNIFPRNKFFGKKYIVKNKNLNKYEDLLEQGYDRLYGVGKKVYVIV
ncbi:MAG: DUF723 domain-containing protein [Elusimicrobiota bacterium]|nr:DUF723 domain-containing protein [Elusimicrobiota bacterium]